MVGVRSVRPIWRRVIVTEAEPSAASRARPRPVAGRWLPPPGRITIITPAKPKATALQRCQPTASPRTSAESATANKGAAKPSVEASASGK